MWGATVKKYIDYISKLAALMGVVVYLTLSFYSSNSVDTTDSQSEILQARADEMRLRLEYMVFNKEKKESQLALFNTLKSQLNLDPYNANLWRDIIYVQDGLNVNLGERDWSFLVAQKLLGWNKHEHFVLFNRCIVWLPNSSSYTKKSCANLLEKMLMKNSAAALSHKLRIQNEEFERVAEFYGVDLKQSNN